MIHGLAISVPESAHRPESPASECLRPHAYGVGERWHNGAGSLPDLRYPVTPMLARILARAVEGTDFEHREAAAGVYGMPRTVWEVAESDGATAQAVTGP